MTETRATALILGSTGRLGRILRWAWDQNPPADLHPIWQTRRAVAGADEIRIDPLGDPEALRRAIAGADVVLDLTGVTTGTEAALQMNVTLAEATVQAAGAVPVLLASSAAIYGPVTHVADEGTPPAPFNAYGRSKLAMEAMARDYSSAKCLRIGNIAGADALLSPAPRDDIIVDTWPDGGTPVRSYLGPATFAAVIATLLQRAPTLPRLLNVAAPGGVAMGDLLNAADLPWTRRDAPATAIPRVVFDTTRLEALHAFAPDAGFAVVMAAEWRDLVAS